MSIFDIGRMCVKIAGRDAGKKCVIVDQLDSYSVLVDGATRRKKVNIKHLEPLADVVEIKAGASHEVVRALFQKLGIATWEKNSKKVGERSKKQKVKRENVNKAEKSSKNAKVKPLSPESQDQKLEEQVEA